MADKANVLATLLGEYARQREENRRQERAREQEIRERIPEAGALMDERAALIRVLPGSGTVEDRSERMREINARIRAELTANGYPEDYLQPVYRCPACRDTGYAGEPIHELCTCIRQRMMDAENASERKGGLGAHSFDQFDLSIFSDEPLPDKRDSQRALMARIERSARRYAEDFPATQKPNLIFYGPAGLGKTFVADCIASRVMDRAYLVRRVTAYRMAEIMRKNQYDGSCADAVTDLIDCDLLLLDDLGTEPQTKSNSGYLFQIINERNNADRHTIISTNLMPEQLRGMYGERVASRLLDAGRTVAIQFYGRDMRLEGGKDHGTTESARRAAAGELAGSGRRAAADRRESPGSERN